MGLRRDKKTASLENSPIFLYFLPEMCYNHLTDGAQAPMVVKGGGATDYAKILFHEKA